MMRLSLLAAASVFMLGACASSPGASAPSDPAATDVTEPKPAAISEFDLALKTAGDLVRAGNTPAAIGRLQMLSGNTKITDAQRAEVLMKLGELSFSDKGYDAKGAVDYFQQVISKYPTTPSYTSAVPMLASAKAKAASLQQVIGNPTSTNTQKFNALFALGGHQDAIELMTQFAIAPDNETLLAMYQFGYLSDARDLTGKAYTVTDRDGTVRTLRFADFGK